MYHVYVNIHVHVHVYYTEAKTSLPLSLPLSPPHFVPFFFLLCLVPVCLGAMECPVGSPNDDSLSSHLRLLFNRACKVGVVTYWYCVIVILYNSRLP